MHDRKNRRPQTATDALASAREGAVHATLAVLREHGRAIMSGGTVRWSDGRRRHPAVVDFAHCVRAWGGLVARGQLRSPKEYVGTHLHFRDGTTSLVFRETLRPAPAPEPAVLVIQFRLAALGSNRWAHAAFRRECVLHTPLFAGFPGFRSKLWADDVTTGVYRGIYEWDGADAARAYATRMVGLLAPFSNADTARFHVVGGLRRDTFLRDPQAAPPSDGADGWWQLERPVAA
jgi:hypothetical protein